MTLQDLVLVLSIIWLICQIIDWLRKVKKLAVCCNQTTHWFVNKEFTDR